MQIIFDGSFWAGFVIGCLVGCILSSLILYFVGLLFSYVYTSKKNES